MARTYRSTPEPHFSKLSQDCIELAKEVNKIPVVKANPELAGTEANLTGLQVGNTKYAVSSGSTGFLVTFTPESSGTYTYTYTADKTYGEIFDAIKAGSFPIAKVIADAQFCSDHNCTAYEDYSPISFFMVGTLDSETTYAFPGLDSQAFTPQSIENFETTDLTAHPTFDDYYGE